MDNRFSKIKRIYDLVNLIFSFGIDHYSRWYISKKVRGIVCDIGAGKGELSYYLFKNKRVKKIIAVEISKDMLEDRFRNSKISYIRGNAENLPLKSKKFDYVASSFVFRNIEDKEKFFKESRRILKKNGSIILLDMTRPSFPLSILFIPYIFLFTKILSIFYPEYNFLRKSIFSFKAKEFIKKYRVKEYKNIFGSIFYLFVI